MPLTVYNHDYPGIYIETGGDPNFFGQAKACLNILRSRAVGKTLIERLSAASANPNKIVVIEPAPGGAMGMATAVPTLDTSDEFRVRLNAPGEGRLLAAPAYERIVRGGAGCSGIARWNPANTIPFAGTHRPAYISLGHELIHCLHYLTADCYRKINDVVTLDPGKDSGLAEEEARTVGLGPYKDEALSENAIRAAFGEPKRTEYNAGNNLSHVKVTPH